MPLHKGTLYATICNRAQIPRVRIILVRNDKFMIDFHLSILCVKYNLILYGRIRRNFIISTNQVGKYISNLFEFRPIIILSAAPSRTYASISCRAGRSIDFPNTLSVKLLSNFIPSTCLSRFCSIVLTLI